MKILVIGSGGREHAIVSKISQSPKVSEIYCAPGNGGIAQLAKCVDIKATDIDGVVSFAKKNAIDLVFVAPDDPLVLGMVDRLSDAGIKAFGPSQAAAIIEGSKAFSKDLMKKYDISTAEYEIFTDYEKAEEYVLKMGAPIVIKADGLALGKGVCVAMTIDEAIDALKNAMLDKAFGDSGATGVIEEFLTGREVSVLCFTDGKTIAPMLSAQDHKRAFDNDQGPNTGGMGAFCPSPYYTDEIAKTCMEQIFKKTVAAMNSEGRTFKGVLYFGLILTQNGPKVIEYNCRFGDPETQAVLPLLQTDLVDIILAIIEERLDSVDIKWSDGAACCIVLASGGYPGKYQTGLEITGLDDVTNAQVYHAGTKQTKEGYVTNGGRVLGVTATAQTLEAAIKTTYEQAGKISFENVHFRTDIGKA